MRKKLTGINLICVESVRQGITMRKSQLHVYMLVFGLLATQNGEFLKFRKKYYGILLYFIFPVLNMNMKCTNKIQCADLF